MTNQSKTTENTNLPSKYGYSAEAMRAAVLAERKRCATECRKEGAYWESQGQKDTRHFEICALRIERFSDLGDGDGAN